MANGVGGGKGQRNAWQEPGPAAFDFRSDVVTTPTASMLTAISNSTLLDDVFAEDPTTIALEQHIASITGHEASLLVLSGTMGNQVALRTHLHRPPHSVLCDHRAHILQYEAGGVASLTGALVVGVYPSNGVYLTLEDVKKNVVLGNEIHSCPTAVISLENTLAGTVMPLSETRRIATFARENNIKLHLDGARIWNAVVAGGGGLSDYTKLFDSVSLCFSKGLGAPIGSILVGDRKFIQHARWIRKSIGGGLRQAGVISAAAMTAVEETFGRAPHGEGGKLRHSHEMASRLGKTWTSLGGQLTHPVETNMVWLNLQELGWASDDFDKLGEEIGLKLSGGRLVVHYQISATAVEKLESLMRHVITSKSALNGDSQEKVGHRLYGT